MGSVTSKRVPPRVAEGPKGARLFKAGAAPAADAIGGVGAAMPPADEVRAAIAAQRAGEAVMPTRENRPVETFGTVADELHGTMSINPKDPKAPGVFSRIAENMTQLVDEAGRATTQEEAADLQMAVGAYQEAFQRLDPKSQQAIIGFLPKDARGQRVAETFQKYIEPVMDRTPGVDPGLRQGRDALLTMEAPDSTRAEFSQAKQLLDRLIADGVPRQEINQAVTADAFVEPFNGPQRGIYSSRDEWPADWALSSYIGSDAASRLRPTETPNEARIAEELLGPYHAMTSQLDAAGQPFRDPVLPNLVGDPVPSRDMLYAGTGEFDRFPGESDRVAARQMRSSGDDVREELFQRAFGMPQRQFGDKIGPADFERVTPLNLDFIAPWWRANTEGAVDGRIVQAPMTPEELTKTIISQYGFLEEQPALRAAAYESLVPQVAQAMEMGKLENPRYRAVEEAGRNYQRNAAGRSLLPGLRDAAPRAPVKVDAENMGDRFKKAIKSLRPKDADVGFVQPMGVNNDMMNNRLLSGLMA